MRLFFFVFFLSSLPTIVLYGAEHTEEANIDDLAQKIVEAEKIEPALLHDLAKNKDCIQIVSGFVTRIQKVRERGNIFQVSMIVKKVFRHDERRGEKDTPITFSYAKIRRLKNTSEGGLESPNAIHRRSRTLDSNSEGPIIAPSLHQRARSFGLDSDPDMIQLHTNIVAYIAKDKESNGYRLLGFTRE